MLDHLKVQLVTLNVFAFRRGVTYLTGQHPASLNIGIFQNSSLFMSIASRRPWIVFGEALVDKFPDAVITGGAPFNAARHLAGLGEDVRFVTRLGTDAYGANLRADMAELGMSQDFVQQDREHVTGTVRVTQSADGKHAFEILANQAYDYINSDELERQLTTLAQQTAQLYHGTLCLRSTASRRAWKTLCAKNYSPRFVDMNWREGHLTHEAALSIIQGADYLKLSDEELGLVLNWLGTTSPHKAAPAQPGVHCAGIEALSQRLQLKTLIVTYGAAGSAVYEQGRCIARADSAKLDKFVDSVGAGDSFSAVCMTALGRGWDWTTTLTRAAEYAAAVCGMRGAVPEDVSFYKNWRQKWQLDQAQ